MKAGARQPGRGMRAGGVALAVLLLAGCAGQHAKPPASAKRTSTHGKKPWKPLGPYTPGGLYAPGVADGAPAVPPDVANLPEPVPHPEPLARYGNRSPYVVLGKSYTVLPSAAGYDEIGMASWYGTKFDGRVTSSLEPYDLAQFSAAHRTLPLPSYARVTNLENGRSVIVRINDRGPFHDGRLIDLSYAAAIKLGVNVHGTARVEVRGIDTGPRPAADAAPASASRTRAPTATPHASLPATSPPPARPAVASVGAADASARPVRAGPATGAGSAMPAPAAGTTPTGASSTALPMAAPAVVAAPPTAPAAAVPTPWAAVASGEHGAAPAPQGTSDATTAATLPRGATDPSALGYLQVGSFGDRDNAQRLLQRLQQAGIAQVELVPVQVADQQMWRIHVGPMRADQAASVAARVRELGLGNPSFFHQ